MTVTTLIQSLLTLMQEGEVKPNDEVRLENLDINSVHVKQSDYDYNESIVILSNNEDTE